MKGLVLDTCGPTASFVLLDTGSPPPLLVTFEGRSASERLVPELRAALTRLVWTPGEIAAVGVVSGPGSFTGARIGVAAAKGLCEAGRRPLVLVSRLAVLVESAAADPAHTVHALLDAGRGEVFYRRVQPGEAPLEALLDREGVLSATAVGGLVVAAEPEIMRSFPEREVRLTSPLTASDALPLVLSRIEQGIFDDVASSEANYLRRTEAEVLERLRRHADAT